MTFVPYQKVKKEFVVLMALMTSVTALSIDAILPALSFIKSEFNVHSLSQIQYIISILFIGFGIGQLFYGPLSDAIGRKKPLYLGGVIFLIGCIISYMSHNLTVMLIGRFLQGLGAAAFRTISFAVVRDEYSGVAMAKTVSLIMTVFILVPVLAPSVGQLILFFAPWRGIFLMLFVLAIIIMTWFYMRQEETLSLEKRERLSLKFFFSAALETYRHPVSATATFISSLIFGVMVSYISSAQHIFQDIYGVGEKFPLYFGSLALTIGISSFINSTLVHKFGIIKLVKLSLFVMSSSSIMFGAFLFIFQEKTPPLFLLMFFFALFFFCLGLLFGNLNTLALSPLGHIAGVASSMIGSAQNFISVAIGALISSLFHNNFIILILCFAALSSFSLFVLKLGIRRDIYSEI